MFNNFTSSNLSYRNTKTQNSNQRPWSWETCSFQFTTQFQYMKYNTKIQISSRLWDRGTIRQVKYGPKILYSNHKLEMSSAYPRVIPYGELGDMPGIRKYLCDSAGSRMTLLTGIIQKDTQGCSLEHCIQCTNWKPPKYPLI